MKRLLLAVLVLAFLVPAAMAADNSVIDLFKKVPAIKQGVGYSIVDSKFNYLGTFQVASFKNVNLEAGYAGDAENAGNKIVAVVSYKIIALKDYIAIPLLDLVEFNVGAYYGIGNLGAGNEPDYGLTATAVNLKF